MEKKMSLKEMAKANLARSNQTRESNPESDLAESFIREMDAATSFLALLQITDQIDPARFAQEEYDRLWGAYSRNRDRWPDEPYPATGWGTFNEADEATLPGASEPCLSGQNQGHPGRITPHLAWTGREVITLPRCGDCQHFKRDTINPREGVGDCEAFHLPDGKRQIVRYPMQDPKTETCFERESPR